MAYTTINKSSLNFNVSTWTGNNNARTISGVGFQPDLVWEKCTSNTYSNILTDSVRGKTKQIRSDTSAGEGTSTQGITAFNSDGYVLGTQNEFANNGNTFVGWNWKAGTSFTNDASSTGVGTIDSAGSVNAAAGLSIIEFTGTGANGTVAHGLGAAPAMIIFKELQQGYAWRVYHKSLANTQKLELSVPNAVSTDATAFNSTSPTSTVFSVGSSGGTNYNGSRIIAYCYAEKQGYSKFGRYQGNSNANGPFINLGFRPSFFMAKATGRSESWYIFDNKRLGYNPDNNQSYADSNSTQGTTDYIDMLSNGIKFKYNSVGLNGNNENYIYMAFGQSIVGTNNQPNNAR